jgi:superfamily II DNA helicase RecQ
LNIILDEGQCASLWNSFRKEYLQLADLRYLIPDRFSFYISSATFPPYIIEEVLEVLCLHSKKIEMFRRSNDQPDISLSVHAIKFAAYTYKDLSFLLPHSNSPSGGISPRKFLVFIDNIKKCEAATKYLRSLMPEPLKDKIQYFHATLTAARHKAEFQDFRASA